MKDEIEFFEKIEQIRELARIQDGVVTKKQVDETFASLQINEQELSLVYDYLKAKKIGVDEKVNLDEYLTEDETDYLNMYLESLSELQSFSDGEKQAYYMSAMAGDKIAKENVIKIMLKDVVDVAKLYTGQGVMLEDLIGEGNVALSMAVDMLGALERPEEVPSTLISTVMNAMEEAIGLEVDEKKIDDKLVSRVNKVADKASKLADELGRKITTKELIEETKLSAKEVEDAIRLSGGIEDIADVSDIADVADAEE